MYLDGHSYSLFDPDEVHADLRTDFTRAQVVLARNRAVAEAHEFCEQCRDIAAARAASPAGEDAPASYPSLDAAIVAHSERATKFVVSRANLARLLGLGAGERIVRMFVSDDPQLLSVIVAGEHFQPVPDGVETPLSRVSRRG